MCHCEDDNPCFKVAEVIYVWVVLILPVRGLLVSLICRDLLQLPTSFGEIETCKNLGLC